VAITQAVCNSFKSELLSGVHDLLVDTIKIALFTSSADLGASTTAYSTTGESSGTGYTAGGAALASPTIALDGSVAVVDFANVTFPMVSITARGALIYNSSKANRSIAVYDFGADRVSTNGDFTVVFPNPTASLGLIRIS
jgi:hypothetical protein